MDRKERNRKVLKTKLGEARRRQDKVIDEIPEEIKRTIERAGDRDELVRLLGREPTVGESLYSCRLSFARNYTS